MVATAQTVQQFAGQAVPQRQYGVGVTAVDNMRMLLEREGIPELLKTELFLFCSKNLALTNITIEIINETIMPAYDTVAQIIYMEMGRSITYQILRWIEELRAAVIIELLRSTGGAERERKIIASGYFEQKSAYQEQIGKQKKGFIGGSK